MSKETLYIESKLKIFYFNKWQVNYNFYLKTGTVVKFMLLVLS